MAYGGALASGQVLNGPRDHFSLGLVIVVAVVGELVGSLLGSLLGYSLGRFGGRPFVDKLDGICCSPIATSIASRRSSRDAVTPSSSSDA